MFEYGRSRHARQTAAQVSERSKEGAQLRRRRRDVELAAVKVFAARDWSQKAGGPGLQ